MTLGVLKLTTVFVFGYFAVVTIPSFVQINAPWWQTACCALSPRFLLYNFHS